jgi:hypothetical protein|tara:strand:- start:146 stop:730 length:585 start_codon:yes stop_codon:yes gene_type:complete
VVVITGIHTNTGSNQAPAAFDPPGNIGQVFISSGNDGPKPGYVYRSGNYGSGYYLTETDCRIFMMSERYCWLVKKFPVWETIAKKKVARETLDCGMTIIQDKTPEMLGVTYADLFQILKFFDTAEIHEKTKATKRLHEIALRLGGCPELIKLLPVETVKLKKPFQFIGGSGNGEEDEVCEDEEDEMSEDEEDEV